MILEKRVLEEFHANGGLSYRQGIAIIDGSSKNKYDTVYTNVNGEYYIKYGETSKYFDNGVRAWALHYDENGNYIKGFDTVQKRSDGSNIVY